ncbi:GNAT family N-acetyltransferase [Pseudonocardia thermophila]|uniref:GNAT family N-acetyltransferase n=1 Tax=Pseudonocardia thermophila TaxID=1848 RepID=UPI00248E39E7|nr:GNAT family N-acetyltransferase [Pseudonocardia thermophila]
MLAPRPVPHVRSSVFRGDLADEWDALVDRVGGSPFQRPGWYACWWDAFGSGTPELVTVRRDGDLVAVLPLARRGLVVRTLTNWHSFVDGPITLDKEAAAELVERVLHRGRWMLELSHLLPDDVELTRRAAQARGSSVQTSTVQRSPYVPADLTFADYVAAREARRVRQLERRRKKLAETGRVTFEVHDGREDADRVVEEFIRVEGLGWKAAAGTAIASQPSTDRFYRSVAAWAARAGMLRLPMLRVDGRAIAGELDLADGRAVYSLKAGFDPALRQCSPGLLVMLDTIEWSLERGLGYEMLGTDEPYKMRWADQVHVIRRMRIHPRTPAGQAARGARLGLRAARKGLAVGREVAKRALAAVAERRSQAS